MSTTLMTTTTTMMTIAKMTHNIGKPAAAPLGVTVTAHAVEAESIPSVTVTVMTKEPIVEDWKSYEAEFVPTGIMLTVQL